MRLSPARVSSLPADRSATGRAGEDAASGYLARHGCVILARNWRANPGEIDIIARCPAPAKSGDATGRAATLVFVEVRTRHGRRGIAEESISRRKASSMASAAYAYMSAHDLDAETTSWRIDLMAIAMRGPDIVSINWLQNAIEEA
jgi:putative endonuclease